MNPRRLPRFLATGAVVLTAAAGVLFAAAPTGATPSAPETADLVLTGGKVVTVDAKVPEGRAIAIRGDRILAVGSVEEIKRLVGPATKVVDLRGRLVIPGFIDSHGHFTGLGDSKIALDLTTARSFDDIVAAVGAAARAAKPGEWIEGRGWHQDKWDRVPEPNVEGLPVHDALSKASPDNPVYLTHASGHSCLVNAKAMELSKITRDTKDPDGGRIYRDARGEPIGAFLETAQDLIRVGAGQPRTAATERALTRRQAELAAKECLIYGVTTFHDAGAGFGTIDVYREMAREDALPVRLYVMMNASNKALQARAASYKTVGAFDNHLTVRAIKRLIDGALGSSGAWLLEPYTDLPTSTGLQTEPTAGMKDVARFAVENGFQLCTHAIGDRAVRETLNVYEEAFRAHPAAKDLRWRVEHAQHLAPADVPRFAALGVIAAMQGAHASSDGPWVPKRLGPKRSEEGAYAWRTLMSAGALISNGTDVPVEPVDTLACFYASVTRKMKDGRAFYPAQRMTREEALRSYTINGAIAGFEEDLKGSLTPGKMADIAVLSKDILTCPEEEIRTAKVDLTVVGGKVVYTRAE